MLTTWLATVVPDSVTVEVLPPIVSSTLVRLAPLIAFRLVNVTLNVDLLRIMYWLLPVIDTVVALLSAYVALSMLGLELLIVTVTLVAELVPTNVLPLYVASLNDRVTVLDVAVAL